MSRVEFMQQAGGSYTVKFLEMSRIFGKDKARYACVFEGEDEKYFSPRLNINLGHDCWTGVASGGKKVAIELHRYVSSHPIYKSYRYAFFLDQDFEHWLENPDVETVYITGVYSIENFYTPVSVFKSIISAEFGISEYGEDSSDFEECVVLYIAAFRDFCQCVSSFNFFAKAHRIMERDGKKAGKLNIRNVKLSDLVSIELDKVRINYDPAHPASLFKDLEDPTIAPESLAEAVETLPSDSWDKTFRGKQQLEFLRLFLSQLKADRCNNVPTKFSKKGNVKLGLSKENCISELSQYALTPQCLKNFLLRLLLRPTP